MKVEYKDITIDDIDNNEFWNDFICDGDTESISVINYSMEGKNE